MSQCMQIYTYMKVHGSITPAEAVEHIRPRCYRLAARIHDLRDSGVDIVKETVHTKDGSYARYRIGGGR